MKRILTTTTLALIIMLVASLHNTVSAQPRAGVSISYQTFYDELDPYGRWMDYPDYGYVWIPDAGPDFRPYGTNGHWVWSDDYEWMWVSDYDWGWAPFHYGRWMEDPYYGWFWVPGYEWSPAWVAWRDGGDYYGWAPLRPGINISIGFSLGGYDCPVDYWSFAPRRYITSPRIYDYYLPRRNNVTIINQTTIINNYNYSRNVFRTGPRRGDAERYAGRINPVRFRDSNRPGRTSFRNNEVSIYRPNVQRDNTRDFTPRRVQRFDRNNSNGNRDNAFRRNGNNLPDRGDVTNSRRFERRNNDQAARNNETRNRDVNNRRGFENRNTEMPRDNNGIRERRRENTSGQADQPDRRLDRPERPNRQFNNNNNNNERMRSRRETPGQDNGNRERGAAERRNYERQPNQGNRPDGFRVRDNNNSSRQMRAERQERQVEQRPPQQRQPEQRQFQQRSQEQPRQSERRESNNNGGGDNGRGGGRGRPGR